MKLIARPCKYTFCDALAGLCVVLGLAWLKMNRGLGSAPLYVKLHISRILMPCIYCYRVDPNPYPAHKAYGEDMCI